MSKLSSYLAQKYLTAEPSSSSPTSSKKRKRKTPKENTGLIIDDDDDSSWRNPKTNNNDEEDDPQYASGRTAEFRKAKKNAWKVVGGLAPSAADLDGNNGVTRRDDDSKAADAIIAEAARENAEAGDRDEAPVIEGEEIDDEVVKMGDGTHAGLQRASDVAAQMDKRKAEEIARWEAEEAAAGKSGKKRGKASAEETVYRDATGRRIDISLRRAEARKELEAAEKREKEKLEDAKGDVQKAKEKERKELLEEAKFMPLARGVDDLEMNDELRSRERWNDPAAMFLSEKSSGGGAGTKGKGKSRSGKKTFDGAAAPNRYGIRPGWRWDGVDRGNGWEGERFREMNRKTRNKDLDFAWQMDT